MTRRNIGIVLVVIAITLAILGINEYQSSTAAVEIGDISISAASEGSHTTAILYLILALISFLGGILLVRRT
ncbi:MAG: hypothetical protein R3275_13230 [Saprospiraceae bacterium]|nr:hypothetical protein [Saprospiraceae bacterium]